MTIMSGRVGKTRGSTAALESATTTVNERILKVINYSNNLLYKVCFSYLITSILYQECHGLYTDNEHGLVTIADSLGLKLLPPRKKITIMLIGN